VTAWRTSHNRAFAPALNHHSRSPRIAGLNAVVSSLQLCSSVFSLGSQIYHFSTSTSPFCCCFTPASPSWHLRRHLHHPPMTFSHRTLRMTKIIIHRPLPSTISTTHRPLAVTIKTTHQLLRLKNTATHRFLQLTRTAKHLRHQIRTEAT